MHRLPVKLMLTIATFGGMMGVCDLVPSLHDYKVMDWTTIPSVLDFADRRPTVSPELEEELRLRPQLDRIQQARHPIADPGNDLDRFYKALHRAAGNTSDGVVRILHYGDSPTTADLITSDVRLLLQKQFGDAGHGFCLIAKPWAWYSHRGTDIQGDGWSIEPATQSNAKDGFFGLGGVSFRGAAGSTARIRMNGKHQHVEIAFLVQPGGGQLRLESAGKDLGVIRTDSEKRESGFARFPLPADARDITIRAMSGPVRLFGVHLERNTPGVVYHSLGVNGAYVSVLAKFFNEEHWSQQLRHYQPHLVIVNYGTNESVYPQFVDYASEKELREVVRRVRKALPEASVLLMSPMDRGQRMAGGEIGTAPAIPRLVAIQERVARESGTAFFNTFEAMGGLGTMGRWYGAEPRLVGADFIHPMPSGAKIVGGLLYQALLDGYNKYKLRLLQDKKWRQTNKMRPARLGAVIFAVLFAMIVFPSAAFQKSTVKKRTAAAKKPKKSAPVRRTSTQPSDPSRVEELLTLARQTPVENVGALVPFFEQLYRQQTSQSEPGLHILHYGDSHTAADEWTGFLRAPFQNRFGDGGNGYSFAGRPWKSYRRMDLKSFGSKGWYSDGIAGRSGDGLYGLGGVSITSSRPRETVAVEVTCETLELYYLQQPGGGSFALHDNGALVEKVSTAGDLGPGFLRYSPSPGFHRFEIETLDTSPVRLFGWVTEQGRGITYETLGINGAQASIVFGWEEKLLASHVNRRNPALIVLAYGTNEAGNKDWTQDRYRDMFASLIHRFRQMAPTASILVIGPPDRYVRVRNRGWRVYEPVERIIDAQREAALGTGCAFWDMRAKMGGKGSMRQWVGSGLAQADYVHFTAAGYRILGGAVFQDLMDHFATFVKVRQQLIGQNNRNGQTSENP